MRNTAAREGTDVVQLYARHRGGHTVRPTRELIGFARVDLDADERATVSFELLAATLGAHDADGRLVLEPGGVELAAGRSAADLRTRASIEVTGETTVSSRRSPLADASVAFP